MLMSETNKYHSQYSDTLDNDGRCSQISDDCTSFDHNNINKT